MKPKLLLMFAAAAMVFAACSKDLYNEGSDETTSDPPTFAASNKIWKFGDQVWSDAIRIPECNKTSFEDSYTDPQCRSYTEQGDTWYYYNWPYVNAHASRLCPSPWRVPTFDDFENLAELTHYNTLEDLWGYGGNASGSSMYYVSERAYYWSSTQSSTNNAYYLRYNSGNLGVSNYYKYYGFQVRCVK